MVDLGAGIRYFEKTVIFPFDVVEKATLMVQSFSEIALKIRQIRKYFQWVILKTRQKLRHRRQLKFMNRLPVIAIESSKSISIAARTTFILALSEALRKQGQIPHVWSKGKNSRQIRLAVGGSAAGLNDDTFILSQSIPTWVCSAPEQAMNAAAHEGATLLLLNGRMENLSCPAIFTIALVDINGNDIESILTGPTFHRLSHMDAVVSIGNNEKNFQELSLLHRPIYRTQWSLFARDIPKNQNVLGFTGVSDSGVLYKMLIQEQYNIKEFIPLAHLNRYKEKQLNSIVQVAMNQKAILATSDKDVPFLPKKIKKQVKIFEMALSIDSALVEEIIRVYHHYKQDALPVDLQIQSAQIG